MHFRRFVFFNLLQSIGAIKKLDEILRKSLSYTLAALFACVILSPLTFTSCGSSSDSDEEETYEIADGPDLGDSEFCKNLGNHTSITLSGVYGKRFFYANYNNATPRTEKTIPLNNTRFVTSASGISPEYCQGSATCTYSKFNIGQEDFPSAGRAEIKATTVSAADHISVSPSLDARSGKVIKAFKEPEGLRKEILSGFKKTGRAAAKRGLYQQSNYSIYNSAIYNNEQIVQQYTQNPTRQIYVDVSHDMNSYMAKNATLRAVGYSGGNPVVLVWVVDEYFGQECNGTTVNEALAQDVADRFAEHYYHERAVFGEEYDFLFDSQYRSEETEAYKILDTGSLINIVIYDIANDHESGDDTGVAGYFFGGKDYFKKNSFPDARAYSNAGKYFYLDAAFCNHVGNGQNENCTISDIALTTLFHEFQHMIHFGQKTIYGLESDMWYNEMLSMLCEDMMADQIGTNNGLSAPWITRISDFKPYYYLSGIDEFRDSDYSICSYATAYAFGAWLAREFGGPEFVSSMSRNHSYANMDSVLYSIHEITGRDYSKRQIYKLFMQACIFQNNFAEAHDLPTFNKDAQGSITAYGKTSLMPAINLFMGNSGPLIFNNGYSPDLRPHGFAIHLLGIANSDTVTINFSRRIDANEDVMIYIQDDF